MVAKIVEQILEQKFWNKNCVTNIGANIIGPKFIGRTLFPILQRKSYRTDHKVLTFSVPGCLSILLIPRDSLLFPRLFQPLALDSP